MKMLSNFDLVTDVTLANFMPIPAVELGITLTSTFHRLNKLSGHRLAAATQTTHSIHVIFFRNVIAEILMLFFDVRL